MAGHQAPRPAQPFATFGVVVMKKKLTDKTIIGLKAGATPVDYWDELLSGFAVRVGTTGVKSFFVYTRINGTAKRITLKPPFPALGLAEARIKAREIITDAQAGISPEYAPSQAEVGCKVRSTPPRVIHEAPSDNEQDGADVEDQQTIAEAMGSLALAEIEKPQFLAQLLLHRPT
jgi:hypothetical protein